MLGVKFNYVIILTMFEGVPGNVKGCDLHIVGRKSSIVESGTFCDSFFMLEYSFSDEIVCMIGVFEIDVDIVPMAWFAGIDE
jgi:hypothetical protein